MSRPIPPSQTALIPPSPSLTHSHVAAVHASSIVIVMADGQYVRVSLGVNREVAELWSDAIGAAGTVIRYGHWGRPVLVFPSEQGNAFDFENNGMVDAVSSLIESGRLKVYCVGSHDASSWSNKSVDLEERARRH